MLYNTNMNYLQTHNGAPDPVAKARATTRPRQRSQHSMPFDPEDLTRRLNVVIAQRTAPRAEKRKDAEVGPEKKLEAQGADLLAAGAGATRAAEGQASTTTATRKAAATTTRAAKKPSALPSKASKAPKVKASPSDVRKPESTKTKSHRTSALRCALAEDPKKHTDQDPSRYVPRNAAAQFESTTTTITAASAETGMQQPNMIHKLSHKAMKFHLGGPTATTSVDHNATAAEQARTLREARNQHDMVLKRNQFQRDRILEEAAEAEEERESRKQQAQQRHLIEGKLFHGGRRSEDQQRTGGAHGRVSMSEEQAKRHSYDALSGGYEQLELVPRGVSEHRVDWTQSDEAGDDGINKPAKGLPLRRASSILTLRARLGGLGKHSREDKIASPIPEDDSIPSGSPLSPRSGFFARFKLSH